MEHAFPLVPFDVDLTSPFVPLPSADFVAVWRSDEFLVRVCNGILHFRRVQVEEGVPLPTFAVVPPLTSELEAEKDLWPLLWEEAMRTESIARFINFPFEGSFARDFPFYLGFDGRGWVRELWNRDDCHFEGSFSPTLARFGQEADLLLAVENIFHERVIPWLERQPPPEPRHDTRIDWLCGSLAELTKVVRATCTLENAFSHRTSRLLFHAETQFERAFLWGASDVFSRWGHSEQLPINFKDAQMHLSSRFWSLIELALDYNTPTGLYWEYHDNGAGRAAYSPYSAAITIEVTPTSAAQRQQARLFLSKWLHGKVPDDEIASLLS